MLISVTSKCKQQDKQYVFAERPHTVSVEAWAGTGQGRSQNLKEGLQNFTEVSNVDDVTANDVIQRNQHRKKK